MPEKKSNSADTVSLQRIRAVVAKEPPSEYLTVGKTAKRPARKAVFKQGVLQLAHGEQLPVAIRNLSLTGCRLEYFKQVAPSGRVLLREPSMPLELWAEVVWRGEGACGLAFEDSGPILARMPELDVQTIEPPLAVRSTPKSGRKRSSIRKRP